MICDHCDKELNAIPCNPHHVVWCKACVAENTTLLNSLCLTNSVGAVMTYNALHAHTDTWGIEENVKKLRAVPKKNGVVVSNKIAVCKVCNTTNQYAVANQTDGSYLCYDCRN
jgi:hypothetical protein